MARFTRLESINEMLGMIGEAPVSSIDIGSPDAIIADQLLTKQTRQVNERGWWFNTEVKFPLKPDTDGFIYLPADCLRVDEGKIYYDTYGDAPNVAQRGNRLYDRENRTYVFTQTTTVYADMVIDLPFEEIPEVSKEYITIRAGRMFQDRTIGDQQQHGYQQVDEQTAYVRLRQAELEASDFNFYNNPDLIDKCSRRVRAPSWLNSSSDLF